MKAVFPKFIFLLIVFQSITHPLKATHFAGSDLSYTCLGGNTYLVTYHFYRDCRGIPVANTMTLNISCSSNPQYNFSVTMNRTPGPGNIITPVCSQIQIGTPCNNITTPPNISAFEEYVFQATVTLVPCNSWTMSITNCCRNGAVSTVQNNSNNYYTSVAKLNNLVAPCNNSPVFTNSPVMISCAYQPYCFNHGAYEPDGDSLSYSFYPVFTTNASTTVNYFSPYSYTNFVQTTPSGITIDNLTGQICFTAVQTLLTLFGVKVEEYRTINGSPVLVGTVYRDLEMLFVPCSANKLPTLSGMDFNMTHTYNPNDTIFSIVKCLDNKPVEFDINGFDPDTFSPGVNGHPERFTLTWNNGIPGANFTVFANGTDSAYAHFSWLPSSADAGIQHCFTVEVRDDACPYNGRQIFSYCIKVEGMQVDIGSDTLLCSGDTMTVYAQADSTAAYFFWSVDGNPAGTPLSQDSLFINSSGYYPGQHILTLMTTDSAQSLQCPGRDTIIIDIVNQPHIQGLMPDTAFCSGGTVVYDAGTGGQFFWSNQSQTVTSNSQKFIPPQTGVYTVFVNGGVNTRCFDSDTFEVVEIPVPDLPADSCLFDEDAPFVLDAGSYPPEFIYCWQDSSHSRFFNVMNTGVYSVALSHNKISKEISCIDSTRISVIDKSNMIMSAKIKSGTLSSISENYRSGDRVICSMEKLKLQAPQSPGGFTYRYKWSVDGKESGDIRHYIFHKNTNGDYKVKLEIAGGCESEIKITTEDCKIFVPNVFTPKNIDGNNDFFKITINSDNERVKGEPFYLYYPQSTLKVYNRWGDLIYISHNYQNNWNGNGSPDGVYFWTLELNDGSALQGTVTIISK